ncbi:uncharacterized protein CTRU02_215386 [Colletotrichum truncatum]|uniref:Uncharacterized protein n=1 Tax=Colletotrichum truncatum TaxID=5467 RepID=A0ACC3YD47_COLTU|nr:uncharacterized protein CTRU02_13341 [Colletotrichum truncatum]KAF6783578.1 hypothetical protein CTRU02_13341 [Colletotrichum truncatum]
MRCTSLVIASLVSATVADFTFYCCASSYPTTITKGDLDWALTAKNGRTAEMGIAGGAKYSWIHGTCHFDKRPMVCARVTTTARTTERGGTKLKGSSVISCEDPKYLQGNIWTCPF